MIEIKGLNSVDCAQVNWIEFFVTGSERGIPLGLTVPREKGKTVMTLRLGMP